MFRTVNDTKIPFHIKIGQILNVLGYKVNIDDHMTTLAKMEKEINDNKTLLEKVEEVNTLGINTKIESLFPPNEMNLSNYKDGMHFEYFAKKNLNNSELPYVLRSNNPLGDINSANYFPLVCLAFLSIAFLTAFKYSF